VVLFDITFAQVVSSVKNSWCAGCADHVVVYVQTCAGLRLTHTMARRLLIFAPLEYYSIDKYKFRAASQCTVALDSHCFYEMVKAACSVLAIFKKKGDKTLCHHSFLRIHPGRYINHIEEPRMTDTTLKRLRRYKFNATRQTTQPTTLIKKSFKVCTRLSKAR
jgi:hypothetical protein